MRWVSRFVFVALSMGGCFSDNPGFTWTDASPDQGTAPDQGQPPMPRPDAVIFSKTDLAPPPSADALPPAEPDTGPACDPGEGSFGRACYSAPGFSNSNKMDYATALQVCAANGAEIASIHGEAENQFVYELLDKLPFLGPSAAWIGLKRTGPGAADFSWEDGSALNFVHWAAGEPNDEEGREDCAVMWGPGLKGFPEFLGRWNDAPCAEPGRTTVVCKRVP